MSKFDEYLELKYKKVCDLRYGENPHQRAALYKDEKADTAKTVSICELQQLHGKELSFNNILDLDAAVNIVREFDKPTCCIIKHNNPCGVASATNLKKAYISAYNCDTLSAFGGIVGANRVIDKATAEKIIESGFLEAVIAPNYENEALNILKQRKNLIIVKLPNLDRFYDEIDIKKVTGGILVQDRDMEDYAELKVVTKRKPTKQEMNSLLFAYKVVKNVKSNAIVLAYKEQTVGIGAGQMSRIDSVIIAARKRRIKDKKLVLASDAFFPKEDNIIKAHKANVTAIIQPGGSIRDKEVIDTCNKYNIAMVFTKTRHFKH